MILQTANVAHIVAQFGIQAEKSSSLKQKSKIQNLKIFKNFFLRIDKNVRAKNDIMMKLAIFSIDWCYFHGERKEKMFRHIFGLGHDMGHVRELQNHHKLKL